MVHSPAPKRVPNVSPTGSYWHVYVWHMSFIQYIYVFGDDLLFDLFWGWLYYVYLRILTNCQGTLLSTDFNVRTPFTKEFHRLSLKAFDRCNHRCQSLLAVEISHDFPMPYTIPKSSPLYKPSPTDRFILCLSLGSPWLNVLKMLLRSLIGFSSYFTDSCGKNRVW